LETGSVDDPVLVEVAKVIGAHTRHQLFIALADAEIRACTDAGLAEVGCAGSGEGTGDPIAGAGVSGYIYELARSP
jgi:hypothetical protein